MVLHSLFSTDDENVDLAVYVNINPLSATVQCFFRPGYTCTIEYGTDPSYNKLNYSDSNSTLNRMATITLSEKIKRNTTYQYIVSAESSSSCVRVQGRFLAGRFVSFDSKLRIGKLTEITHGVYRAMIL